MRILVAGASGVIGQRLVRLLAASGHAVTGTTRSPTRAVDVRASGATPLVVDVFDAMRLADAVAAARPEVIVHQLTDLLDRLDPRAGSSPNRSRGSTPAHRPIARTTRSTPVPRGGGAPR